MIKQDNTITFSISEIEQKAIKAMEECMSDYTVGNIKNAIRSRGQASVWEELLYDEFDIDLAYKNRHYGDMYNIWIEALGKIVTEKK